jgi:beta-fructofuranosidase
MAVARDDDLNQWQKLDSNPITPKTQPGDPNHDKYRSWDPFGWLEGDTYYAIFGGERPGLVKAPSLGGEWRYVGDFLANTVPGVALNEDVSCADFFRLGDRYMLLCISHRLGARYYLGDWLNEQFHPTFHEKMSWVDHLFFAPESLLDDRGRRIMWSWVFDRPGFQTRTDYGWSGTMSLPRVLSLGPDGRLCQNPPEEIQRLRHNPKQWANLRLNPDSDRPLEGIAGNSLELELVANIGDAKQLGLAICRSPDGQEQTRIFYDATDHQLKVDTTRASLKEDPRNVEAGPFALDPGQPLTLRVFVDKSIVEVFANGRQAVTRRMYPSRPDSLGVALFATGGPATLTSLQAWDLEPSNPF